MKLKKYLFTLPIVACAAIPTVSSMTSCSQTSFTEKKDVKMLDAEEHEVLKTDLLYKEGSNIALISVTNGFKVIQELHKTVFDPIAKFAVSIENGTWVVKRENGAKAVFNPNDKTITVYDFRKFAAEGTSRESCLIGDYGGYKHYKESGVKFVAYGDLDSRVQKRETTVFDLRHYGIPMYTHNGELYLPLQTLSDIFLCSVVIEPICVLKDIIIPASAMPAGRPGQQPQYPKFIKDNALDINPELLEFNYNETCLYLDHFLGPKAKEEVGSYDNVFRGNKIKIGNEYKSLRDCMLTSVEEADKALNWFLGYAVDDGHTVFLSRSASSKDTSPFYREMSVNRIFLNSERARYCQARQDAGYETPTGGIYETGKIDPSSAKNDTAILRFDSFNPIPDDFTQTDIPADPNDAQNAIEFFTSAYRIIADSASSINNVVVDLSCNGGGDCRFCIFLASMLIGGELFVSHRYTVDNTINTCSYYADCNLDGKIDDNDFAMKNKNVYILTSRYSYSCGNILPTVLFDKPNVKTIGKQSGGGACVVMQSINALGTRYQLSGPMQMGYIKNGIFYDNDRGIDPAFYVPDSMYYNPNNLLTYIYSHR